MTSVLVLALAIGAPAPKDPPKKDPAFVGDWVPESVTVGGQKVPIPPMTFRFTADGKFERQSGGDPPSTGTFTVVLKKDPAYIDLTSSDGMAASPVALSIFKVEGNTMTICTATGGDRPTAFASPAGSMTVLLVFKRKKD